MKQTSTFSSCPHAHYVFNKYTGEPVMVPCGKCVFCRMAKGAILSSRLSLEASYHPYNLFFTLTYDNEHIPYAQSVSDFLRDNGDCSSSLNALLVSQASEQFREFSLSQLYFFEDSQKVNILSPDGYFGSDFIPPVPHNFDVPNTFGVLKKTDAQKFIKRLRYYVYADPDNLFPDVPQSERRFRYYICGEYGPTTFRPHYHGLLFCDNAKISQAILTTYIYKAWTMCSRDRIDVQYVTKDAGSYVSSYVTSYLSMPRILSQGAVRPFYLCSKAPALGVCPQRISECFSSVSQGIVTENISVIDRQTKLPLTITRKLPVQVTRWLFPKCTNFQGLRKSHFSLLQIYFPFLSSVAKTEYMKSRWHYDSDRFSADGTLGRFDERNILCHHRAIEVCKRFNLTPGEYIDLLLSFYSKTDLYGYSKHYEALEDWSHSVSDSELKRCIFASTNFDWISIYSALPDKILPEHLEFSLKDGTSLSDFIAAWKADNSRRADDPTYDYAHEFKDKMVNVCTFHVKPFDSIPSLIRDLFHVDIGTFLACYKQDSDGVFHLDRLQTKAFYDPETNPLIRSQRLQVISSYQGVLARKKVNQNPHLCKSLNKTALL